MECQTPSGPEGQFFKLDLPLDMECELMHL